MRSPTKWRPARLRPFDILLITIALWVTATIRGLDYLTGDDAGARPPRPGQTNALVGIEAAFPLWLWGISMVIACTLLGLGVLRGWHAYVWWGHVLLSVIYTGLCVGLIPGYLDRSAFDGIRSASGLLLPVVVHFLIWWRMGRRPIDPWRTADATAA